MAPKTGGGLLRVNSNAVLVVPPFECAWLQSTESIESGCCISFDVKGGLLGNLLRIRPVRHCNLASSKSCNLMR